MVNSSVKQKDIGFKTQPGPVAKIQFRGFPAALELTTTWNLDLRFEPLTDSKPC